MSKIIKNILKTIVNILTILIFIILVFVIVMKTNVVFSGKNYFEIFDYSIFKVTTGSMNPTIKENDIILVKKESDYKINDIITFKGDNAFITHRIISVTNDNFVTKGDANNTNDTSIKKDLVIGRVVRIFAGLGIWQTIFTTPKIIITIFITLILFDLAFSYKSKKDIKERTNSIQSFSKKANMPLLKQIQGKNNNKNNLSDEEIKELYDKLNNAKPAFNQKENEFLDYTIRLDLNELQKEINSKINK